MNIEEAIRELKKYLSKRKITYTKLDRHDKAIETVLKELEDNQADLTTVYIKGVCDEKSKWRDKIKAKIEKLNEKPIYQVNGDYCGVAILVLKELLKESD